MAQSNTNDDDDEYAYDDADLLQRAQLTTSWQVDDGCSDIGPVYHYVGGRQLAEFRDWYQNYHGYLATVVCVFGIVANALNIVVLTRRNMVSATNSILTGLAVADGLTMVAYLPFALRFYVLYGTTPTPERNSLPAVCFMLFYACFSVVVHTVAIWLTVVLAVFRYVFIRYPRHGAEWCSLARSKLAIALVHLVTLVVCIPNFLTMTLISSSDSDSAVPVNTSNTTCQWAGSADVTTPADRVTQSTATGSGTDDDVEALIWNVGLKATTQTDRRLQSFNFWIQALLVKLTPCLGLTVLSLLLVKTMKEAEARRQNLRAKKPTSTQAATVARNKKDEATVLVTPSGGSSCGGGGGGAGGGGGGGGAREKKTNRTTRMLLVVVVLFLVTEFPQGVINLLSGVLPYFVDEVYMALGDLLDILALINNGINFILYCTMSKQFRDTFVGCFRLEGFAAAVGRCVGRVRGRSSSGIDGGANNSGGGGQLLKPASARLGCNGSADEKRKQTNLSPRQTTTRDSGGGTLSTTLQISSGGEQTISACIDV